MYKPFFPVRSSRLNDDGETYTPQPIVDEVHTISEGYIKLHEVPHYTGPESITIPGYAEVFNIVPVGKQFKVNYNTGRVYFDSSEDDGVVKVTYSGIGSLTAIDEINWLWEQLLDYKSFKELLDTPNHYEGHEYDYVQVNHNGTGVTFSAPTAGVSTNSISVFEITPTIHETRIPGTSLDMVQVYSFTNPESISRAIDFIEPIHYNTSETENGYALTDPSQSNVGCIYFQESSELNDINDITSISLSEVVPDGAATKYLFNINGNNATIQNGEFIYTRNQYDSEFINNNGFSASALDDLPQSTLNKLLGCSLGLLVYIEGTGVESPQISGSLIINGFGGRTYIKDTALEVKYDSEQNEWVISGTAEGQYVCYQGSGNDGVCCVSHSLEFNSLAPGQTVKFRTPRQTTVQVYSKELTTQSIAVNQPWNIEDLTGFNNYFVRVIPDVATYDYNSLNLYSLVDFNTPGTAVLGNTPEFNNISYGPGLFGNAAIIGRNSSLKFYNPYLHYTQSSTNVYYLPRCVGGWFKLIGTAGCLLFTSGLTLEIYDYYYNMGYYARLSGVLYKNKVVFTLGRFSKTLYYPEGEWVYVALSNVRNRWGSAVYKYKGGTFTVNNQQASLYWGDNRPYGTTVPFHAIETPAYIGGKSPTYYYNGSAYCDNVYVANESVPALSPKDIYYPAYVNMFPPESYKQHTLENDIDVSNYTQLFGILNEYAVNTDTKILFKIDGTLYTYVNGLVEMTSSDPALRYQNALRVTDLDTINADDFAALDVSSLNVLLITKSPSHTNGESFVNSFKVYTEVPEAAWIKNDGRFTVTWEDDAHVWHVKNNTTKKVNLKVNVIGKTEDNSIPQTFTALNDTPATINDTSDKILVSRGGQVIKRKRIHPFLTMGV